MLEYANLLIRIINLKTKEIKYLPVDNETGQMTLQEAIEFSGVECPSADIVYNNNDKSSIIPVFNRTPMLELNNSWRIWYIILYELLAEIIDYQWQKDKRSKEDDSVAVKHDNDAKLTLYTIYGEEITNEILKEIENIPPSLGRFSVAEKLEYILNTLEEKISKRKK